MWKVFTLLVISGCVESQSEGAPASVSKFRQDGSVSGNDDAVSPAVDAGFGESCGENRVFHLNHRDCSDGRGDSTTDNEFISHRTRRAGAFLILVSDRHSSSHAPYQLTVTTS
jgi:hypothetical protein